MRRRWRVARGEGARAEIDESARNDSMTAGVAVYGSAPEERGARAPSPRADRRRDRANAGSGTAVVWMNVESDHRRRPAELWYP
jgi:hypothetical protein